MAADMKTRKSGARNDYQFIKPIDVLQMKRAFSDDEFLKSFRHKIFVISEILFGHVLNRGRT